MKPHHTGKLIPNPTPGVFTHTFVCRFCCAIAFGDQGLAGEEARQQRRRKQASERRASTRFLTVEMKISFVSSFGFRSWTDVPLLRQFESYSLFKQALGGVVFFFCSVSVL